MHTLTRALFVVAACVPLVGVAQETPKVDANSMLVVVRGCPKGRAIVPLAMEGEAATPATLVGRAMRLNGTRDLMKQVEAEKGHLIEVTGLVRRGGVWEVAVRRGADTWTHASRQVVNCAGLHADAVAALAGVDVDGLGLRQRWVKGNYFAVDPRHAGRLSRLVYPVPPQGRDTLGVHVCLDLAGQMRLGPDFETVPRREDYGVDPARAGAFFAGAARFLPWLEPQDLQPALSGLRPKLDTDAPFADFQVRRETGDLEGLIDLIGIDSPGLTSAPALAEIVAALLDDREPWIAP